MALTPEQNKIVAVILQDAAGAASPDAFAAYYTQMQNDFFALSEITRVSAVKLPAEQAKLQDLLDQVEDQRKVVQAYGGQA